MSARPTFVIVGASLAGATAAATLREEGFNGRLVMIGEEPLPPYERPGLSKQYLRGEEGLEELFVRESGFWEAHGIEARFGERVQLLDPQDRAVVLDDGQTITFDKALIATGVKPRKLGVPGADLPGVMYLRTVQDSDAIRRAASAATSAAVVGMGFIGAEVAASLRLMGLEVTVVEVFETALYRVLGPRIGRVLEAAHRDQGVKMVFNDSVVRFEGTGRLERIITKNGASIDCDLAVVGVGTVPVADVMRDHSIASNGGIEVGPTLESLVPGVFAAGDVATHYHPVFGPVRVEHFDNAIKMGEHAARAMLGAERAFDDPHWFWSDQYDHQIQMGGVAVQGEMVLRGSLEERSFCAFFLDEAGVLRASVSFDWPRDCRRSLKLIQAQVAPDRDALADPDVDLRSLVPGDA